MLDLELDELRARVDCRTVLETAGWALDRRGSTANAVKYRCGVAQIVIVTHRGRGWFDPLSEARGDVLALAQHLWGGTLGHARKALRPLAGVAPALRIMPRDDGPATALDAPKAWRLARRLASGSQGWGYLTRTRGLPPDTLARAIGADLLREGIHGTVWALHRTGDHEPCGWEMRGPRYKGFCTGGAKALFWIGALAVAPRIAVTESAIDALSLATLERWPAGTAYVSTGGGFGPRAVDVFRALVPATARLVAATDRGPGGDLLAERLRRVAATCGARFGRLRPAAKDWNAQLTGM